MFGLSENRVKWKPTEQTLPAKAEVGFSVMTSVIVPCILIFLGILFIYLPWTAGGELSVQLVSTIISIGLIIFALLLFVYRCSIVITENYVEKSSRGFPKTYFKESLSNYRGLERVIRVSHGKHNTITFHEIVLRHISDPKKDITLFSSYSPEKLDNSLNNFSALLRRPII